MLSHGANVDQEDIKGYTPLFYAASNCCLEILFELLDKGHAHVNHVAKSNNKTDFEREVLHGTTLKSNFDNLIQNNGIYANSLQNDNMKKSVCHLSYIHSVVTWDLD